MKKLLLALTLCLAPSLASAQCSGVFSNNTVCGNATGANNTPRMTPVTSLPSGTLIVGATPVSNGTNSYLLYNNNGVLGNEPFTTFLANPTAQLGLTAINGTAGTAMRSDAAPPLDQGIIPTWTGTHTFNILPILPAQAANTAYMGPTSGVAATPDFRAIVPADIPVQTQVSVTGTHSILASECTAQGTVLNSSGATFYVLTLDAASGYSAGCKVTINNTVSTAFRYVTVTGGNSCYVPPNDSITIQNIGAASWAVPNCRRWKIPSGTTTLSFSGAGTDTLGASDGLSAPFASSSRCLAFWMQNIDNEAGPLLLTQSAVVCQGPGSGYSDSVQVHVASHAGVGAFGSGAITLDGGSGGTVLNNANGTQVYYEKIRFKNIKFVSSAGNGLTCGDQATCYISTGVEWGDAAGTQVSLVNNSNLYLEAGQTFSGNAVSWLNNKTSTVVINSAITNTISADITYSAQMVIGTGGGITDLQSITWSLGGHTVTTNTYTAAFYGYHYATGCASIPGTGSPLVANLTGSVTVDCSGVTTTSFSYPVLAPDGTVGAPTYSFSASTSTGVYSPSANVLGIAANGTLMATFSSAATVIANSGTLAVGTGIGTGTGTGPLCYDNSTGAVTYKVGSQCNIATSQSSILAASGTWDMNSTADQAVTITLPVGFTSYRILQIVGYNASASLTTAAGGMYTSAGKAGAQVVPTATTYSTISSTSADTVSSALIISASNYNIMWLQDTSLFFSLTTPQGTATTMKYAIYILPLP